ncbi:MAG: hypothetical protein HKP11_09725 [Flavobacteriaceae bacterium]|nr:hypothetical protein [Flavobacteriaceae bacterium]
MAYLEGAEILELKLLPGIHEELGFYFGYVKHSGDTTWLTESAPFFSDLIIVFITSLIITFIRPIRFHNALLLFGFGSPIVDLIYNYQGGLWRSGTDVSDLLELLPKSLVHATFILSIVLCVMLFLYFRKRKIKTTHNRN